MFKKFIWLFILPAFVIFIWPFNTQAASLSERLRGKILLQVEQNGEAWYLHPENLQRYYLGRPEDAFRIMRELGLGISNENLNKIAVGYFQMSGSSDLDLDGLPDAFEDALGTNKLKMDTDGDGFSDHDEVEKGFNPLGAGMVVVDINLSSKMAGRILLQVESAGEAWYINPVDNKRYYLGRPTDAFSIMRALGLGISNNDLYRIRVAPGYDITEIENEKAGIINEQPQEEVCNNDVCVLTGGGPDLPLKLSSPEFNYGDTISTEFSCDGRNVNPQLNIENIPEGTQTLVLILDDSDSANLAWEHWNVYNITGNKKIINENTNPGVQGVNSYDNFKYDGPCPPAGERHHYYFRLYALDTSLHFVYPGVTSVDLTHAMQGHILEETELMGVYSR